MRSFIAFAALCAVFAFNPAIADDAPASEAVRIDIDQATKAFVFIIDNEPVAMLDKQGLHVVGDIAYGKSITDAGPDWIKNAIASRSTEATHD